MTHILLVSALLDFRRLCLLPGVLGCAESSLAVFRRFLIEQKLSPIIICSRYGTNDVDIFLVPGLKEGVHTE